MEGFIELVGVKVVEQLGDDWPKAGKKKKHSKAANEMSDILKKTWTKIKRKCSKSGMLRYNLEFGH